MAYVGMHRALRPLPLRHPTITAAGVAAVIGIGASALALATSGPDPARTVLADEPPVTSQVTQSAVASAPLPSGSPLLTPVVQQSPPPSTRTHTTTRTRRATETVTRTGAPAGQSTRTVTTTRSTRTSTQPAQGGSTVPPNGTVTHPPVVTTTTTEQPTSTTTTDAVAQGSTAGRP